MIYTTCTILKLMLIITLRISYRDYENMLIFLVEILDELQVEADRRFMTT